MTEEIRVRFEPEALRHMRPGDLVFSRGRGAISMLSRWGQGIKDDQYAEFSHVSACVYPGLFVHSIPKGGVQTFNFEQENGIDFRQHVPAKFAAIRFDSINLDIDDVTRVIGYWMGQTYSFRFLTHTQLPGSVFCSQLIIQILDKVGIELPGVRIGAPITPSALYRIALENGARDVSSGYVDYAERLARDPAEFSRLRNNMVRRAVQSTIAKRLNLARIEAAINQTTSDLNYRSLGELIENRSVIFGRGSVSGADFSSECDGIPFAISYSIKLLVSGPRTLLPRQPENWLDDIYSINTSVLSNTVAVNIACFRRFREIVSRVFNDRVQNELTLWRLHQLPDASSSQTYATLNDVAAKLSGFPDLPLLDIHQHITAIPKLDYLSSDVEDIVDLYYELEALREEWRQLVVADLNVRRLLVDVFDRK